MARLAIRGHATRGKEVIDTLKMLGGKIQQNRFWGDNADNIYCWYYIDKDGYIVYTHYTLFNDITNSSNITFFTLEEFLEKFPYKIGDKVSVYGYETKVHIEEMKWDGFKIQYLVFTDETEWYSAEELNKYNEPYKKETMETDVNDNKTILNMSAIDYNNGLVEYEIPVGYEFDIVIDNKIVLKKLKTQYPKTYEECARLLNTYCGSIGGYNWKLLSHFQQLLICRDAYLKIVGEQMGLGKPWEPDWNCRENKFCIGTYYDKIEKFHVGFQIKILAFPTSEIRDTFYENFKDLIETCKQFL